MRPREIQSGCFYVNEPRGLVREVLAVRVDGQVEYLSYWLSDGTSDGIVGHCHQHTIARWANRELTVDEIARLKRDEARQRADERERELRGRLEDMMSSQAIGNPLEAHIRNGITIRDEANALVACAFRNGPLEDLHAGKDSELLSDPSLSRITNEEMKALLINACRQLAKLLELKATNLAEYERQIKSYNWRYCRGWER